MKDWINVRTWSMDDYRTMHSSTYSTSCTIPRNQTVTDRTDQPIRRDIYQNLQFSKVLSNGMLRTALLLSNVKCQNWIRSFLVFDHSCLRDSFFFVIWSQWSLAIILSLYSYSILVKNRNQVGSGIEAEVGTGKDTKLEDILSMRRVRKWDVRRWSPLTFCS